MLLQINSQQIRNNAVIADKIANNAVTADKIATDAVTTDKILNANVTLAKLATDVTTALTGAQDTADAAQLAIDNHISDTSDAHDASAISVVASNGLAATDVQGALDELQGDINGINNAAADYVLKAGSTMTGFLTLSGDPTSTLHAATKQYVDSVAQGLGIKQAVRAATTADLGATYNNGLGNDGVGATLTANSNGAVIIDGVTLIVGDRVLIKNQTNAEENGIYDVTATGDGSNLFVLTRSADANNSPVDGELRGGTFVFVTEGSTQDNQGYAISSPTGAIDLGVDDIVWTQFNGAGAIVAGNGLTQTGNQIDVVAGDGLIANTNSLDLVLDGSTLSKSGTGLKVADAGITETQLNSSVAGAGLAGGAGSALRVNVDNSTIEIATDTLQVKDGGITDAKLAAGIDAAKIADGSVSNTGFQYLGGVTSDIQSQLNDKVAKAGDTMTGNLTINNNTGNHSLTVIQSGNNRAIDITQNTNNNGIYVTSSGGAATIDARNTNTSGTTIDANASGTSATAMNLSANGDTAKALVLTAGGTSGIALQVNSGQSLFNGIAGVTIATGNTISWAGVPTVNAHLANKQYVDSAVTGATVNFGYNEFIIDSTQATTNASAALPLSLSNATAAAGQFIQVYVNGQLQVFDNGSNSSIAAYTKPANDTVSMKTGTLVENDVVQIHYRY